MSNHKFNVICDYITARSAAVEEAYQHIITKIIESLRSLENPSMRTHIQIEQTDDFSYQFLSPIVYTKLSSDHQTIHFAKDLELSSYLGMENYIKLNREFFHATMKEHTAIDIEDCLEEYEFWFSEFEDALLHPNAIITNEDLS